MSYLCVFGLIISTVKLEAHIANIDEVRKYKC
jgi:hypothetical protein